ncbi:MAG: bifunctional DNA primase/helicase, partial [archaeon]|nr:bifunctional DNA primase/helicase [archaeon]
SSGEKNSACGERGEKRPDPRLAKGYHRQLFEEETYADMLEYLSGTTTPQQRHLSVSVLKKYRVGAAEYSFAERDGDTGAVAWKQHRCITFPWIGVDEQGKLFYQRLKVRSMTSKACMRLDPAGGEWGFFGWHTVPPEATEVVITEGEYDAMAVHQATKMPAISLPNGARSLPVQLLPLLERFRKIYLWMDDDVAGHEGARIFAQKLGIGRCLLVATRGGATEGPKDANDALRQGMDLRQILKEARATPHQQIMTFDDLRKQVHREFSNPIQVAGVQSKLLPSFSRILKGHRPGELSIFTGPTGMGKTTLLSLVSLDLAMSGVNTLWGSFELNNIRLAKKMMNQFANKNLADPQHLPEFDMIADQFRELPLYFLRFWGSTSVEDVIEAMEYALYVHDVRHVVLDNLQFMAGGRAVGADKFQVLDYAIEQFRCFATHKNVHISLVIHPRKQAEHVQLHMSDVFGTAKAIQEADNVIILQSRPHGGRTLEIKKNRFDGVTGTFPIIFERMSDRFRELNPVELEQFNKQTATDAEALANQYRRHPKPHSPPPPPQVVVPPPSHQPSKSSSSSISSTNSTTASKDKSNNGPGYFNDYIL